MDDFIFEEITINSQGRNFAAAIKAKEQLYKSKNIEVYDTEAFGRCLYLDGSLQLCEKYEHMYHEAIVHPGLYNVPSLQKVLIIGGGDGGTLREVLKYKGLKKVVFCEILPEIVDVSRQHLPFTKLEDSLQNPIVELVYQDGAKYVQSTKEYFDAVIVDCSDPQGNSEVLYSREFLTNCRERISQDGSFAIQATNAFVRDAFVRKLEYELRRIFGMVKYMFVPIPSYVTGGIGFFFAGDRNSPKSGLPADLKFINERTIAAGFAMCHDVLYKNKLEELFDKYCETFLNWKEKLSPAELEYVLSSFQFESEPVSEEGQVKHLEFGHSVMKGGVSCEYLTVMTEENDEEMQPLTKELIKKRKAVIPKGLKVKGVRFCTMFKTCEYIMVLTLDELRVHYPELYAKKPDRCYDKVRVHLAYSNTRFCMASAVFSDLSRRYYVGIMDWEAELIRPGTDIKLTRDKLNSYGKVLIDAFGREGVRPYEVIWKNKDCYDISFAA